MKKFNIDIDTHRAEEGDVKTWKEFFVEVNAEEIQMICMALEHKLENYISWGAIAYDEYDLYKKLSDFDNHYNQDKTYIQHYTG